MSNQFNVGMDPTFFMPTQLQMPEIQLPQLNLPTFNFAPSTFTGNIGIGAWNTPSGNSSRTESEILADDQYRKIRDIIGNIISKCGDLSPTDKAKLEAAKNKSGSSSEKIKILQNALKEISEDGQKIVKDFILEKSQDIKINNKSIGELVTKTGLGSSKQVTSDKIIALKNGIERSSTPEELAPAGSLIEDLNSGTIDILELVSQYNSNETSLGIMPAMIKRCKEEGSEHIKLAVDLLVNKLIERASSADLRQNLDDSSIKNLDNAIAELKNTTNYDVTKTVAFNELYKLTRLAAATDLDARLKKEYGDLLPDIIGTETITNKTIEDLDKEGFDVDLSAIGATTTTAGSNNTDQATEQDLTSLVNSKVLVQTNTMYTIKDENGQPLLDVNGNEIKVRLYEEKYCTDDRDYKRVFYTHKGKVYELLNKNIEEINGTTSADQVETDISMIKTAERTDFSDLEIGLTQKNFNLGSVPGYYSNDTEKCKGYGAYDVAGKVLVNDMKAQVEVAIKKQLKDQGYDTNSVEFSNLFEAAYADAKSYACDKCVKVKEGKSSWNAFWSGDGLSGWKTSSSVNIKDLVDTFIKKFNNNINNSIKNKPLANWEETPKKEESIWKKAQKVAPWVSALGCGAGLLIGGPVGWGIGIASTVIAAGSALTSCCKTIGKWLGL